MVVRAATERADLARALGVNVDRWITPMFGFGLGLAALAGVLAAPMRNVAPLMGSELIILTFAVVVIGGVGPPPRPVAGGVPVWGLSAGRAALVAPPRGVLALPLHAALL